ncbi:hypothetical protein WBP06_04145 [Novosphingobium sp. BL-8H]|uniref:hypothetical protein n=1 Tax=Novosphingobium sp. BL-8H TaxID=3127640 RepID=UPI003757EFA5
MAEYTPEDSRDVTGSAATSNRQSNTRERKPPKVSPDHKSDRAREAELHPDKEDERLNPGQNTGSTSGVG